MCDEREQVLDYLYDECDAATRRKVEQHVAACASCRDELRGWQSVRTDLLAWDVPEQTSSVWTPFAPPKVAPWYSQVPVWALASAAACMFAIGAAGGYISHIATAAPVLAQSSGPAVSMPAVLTPEQIRALVRAEVQSTAASVKPVQVHATDEDALMRRVATLVSESEARMTQAQGEQTVAFYKNADAWRTQDQTNFNVILDAKLNGMRGQVAGDVLRTVNRALSANQPDTNKKER